MVITTRFILKKTNCKFILQPVKSYRLYSVHLSHLNAYQQVNIRVVCADRPEKPQPRRVRWTAGGDRIEYPGSVTTKTADITTAKLLINSTISVPGRRFMTMDLKDFYLSCALDDYEYVRIPVHLLPSAIRAHYKLDDTYERNGHIYAECRRGMYGLPQAGKLANMES